MANLLRQTVERLAGMGSQPSQLTSLGAIAAARLSTTMNAVETVAMMRIWRLVWVAPQCQTMEPRPGIYQGRLPWDADYSQLLGRWDQLAADLSTDYDIPLTPGPTAGAPHGSLRFGGDGQRLLNQEGFSQRSSHRPL